MKKYLTTLLLLTLIIPNNSFSEPKSKPSPTIVQMGIYLTHIEKIDVKAQTFNAEFYLNMKWKGKHSPVDFEMVNANNFEKYFYEEWVDKDTNWLACKIRGTFRCKMDVSNFPFDQQDLVIRIGDFNWIADSLEYKINPTVTGKSNNIYSAEWKISSYRAQVVKYSEMKEKYSSFEYYLTVDRKKTSFFIKILIPILIVMGVSMLNLFIDKKELEACIGLGVTALLSIIALYFSISDNLPDVNYATTVDKMMMGSYLLIFITMIEIVVAHNFIRKNNIQMLNKVERLSRWLIPFGYLIFLIILFLKVDLFWFLR